MVRETCRDTSAPTLINTQCRPFTPPRHRAPTHPHPRTRAPTTPATPPPATSSGPATRRSLTYSHTRTHQAAAAPKFKPSNATILSSQSDMFTDFLRSKLDDDLSTVPGIGPASKSSLQAASIETTHHLIGKFLMLRDPDCQVRQPLTTLHAICNMQPPPCQPLSIAAFAASCRHHAPSRCPRRSSGSRLTNSSFIHSRYTWIAFIPGSQRSE